MLRRLEAGERHVFVVSTSTELSVTKVTLSRSTLRTKKKDLEPVADGLSGLRSVQNLTTFK